VKISNPQKYLQQSGFRHSLALSLTSEKAVEHYIESRSWLAHFSKGPSLLGSVLCYVEAIAYVKNDISSVIATPMLFLCGSALLTLAALTLFSFRLSTTDVASQEDISQAQALSIHSRSAAQWCRTAWSQGRTLRHFDITILREFAALDAQERRS
jgi:hypothetical protein